MVDGILFLESSPYITGEILHIDGGQIAGHLLVGPPSYGRTLGPETGLRPPRRQWDPSPLAGVIRGYRN